MSRPTPDELAEAIEEFLAGEILPTLDDHRLWLDKLLRFARLCQYLRVREADATIGHSIFIYRLDASEISGAVGGSLNEWRQLIERAVLQRQTKVRAE